MIREDSTVYIATISGGKDSVTMCDLLLKNGYPVDEIIFTDTREEFEEMYIYLEKVKEYFLTRYKKTITVLKPKKTFAHWALGTIQKDCCILRKNIDLLSVSNSNAGWDSWTIEVYSKISPLQVDKIINQMLDELGKINAQVVLGNTGEYYDKSIQSYTNIIQIRTPKTLNIKNTN